MLKLDYCSTLPNRVLVLCCIFFFQAALYCSRSYSSYCCCCWLYGATTHTAAFPCLCVPTLLSTTMVNKIQNIPLSGYCGLPSTAILTALHCLQVHRWKNSSALVDICKFTRNLTDLKFHHYTKMCFADFYHSFMIVNLSVALDFYSF